MKPKYLYYWILPVLGTAFCLWYIKSAACDVIYSDYVRLVNSYLPDVWNPDKFFVADVLTRIPVNYLGRILNVGLFGFSLTFDRVLGALGLGLGGLVLAGYSRRKGLGPAWYAVLMVVMFSLNKWEMLTNGSGWAHFLAFGCFYYHYVVLDRSAAGREKPLDRLRLILLPFVITLGIAGPYCAIYLVTLCLAYGFVMLNRRRKAGRLEGRYLLYGGCALLALILYLWSNSYAVEDHAGAVQEPLLTALLDKPAFFGRFFIKSFASMVLGGEVMLDSVRSDGAILFLGFLVMAAYGLALWMNLRFRLYERTLLPLLLVAAGGLNHVLILVSRWIFIDENYAMSSRYALQFQVGVLGIILTMGLLWKRFDKRGRRAMQAASLVVCVLFLTGNVYTSYKEMLKAPYREERFLEKAALALDYEERSDEELRAAFEYRQTEEGSGAKVREALRILQENHWNVFRNQEDYK